MADFSSLKQTIQSYIKQNGNEEITGNILQDVLLAMVTTMGDSAINSLASALQDEITARQNQDGTLQGNIASETTARQQADTALGGRIDGLQTVINGINTKLAEGYIYAGIATPSTNPGTPSGKVFYIAVSSGTYTNFSNLTVAQGINILKYNGSSWSKDVVYAIDARPKKASQNLVTSGGVFDNMGALDVSELNATENPHTLAQYADLSAALAAIPTDYQKGGMSVKFVHSSDNKYVQYRLMSDTFSTTVTDWQGVDDEPTPGSDNLVKSGGVVKYTTKQRTAIGQLSWAGEGKGIHIDTGADANAANRNRTDFLSISDCESIVFTGIAAQYYVVFYDLNFEFISSDGWNTNKEYNFNNIPSGAVYCKLMINTTVCSTNEVKCGKVILDIDKLQKYVDNLKNEINGIQVIWKEGISVRTDIGTESPNPERDTTDYIRVGDIKEIDFVTSPKYFVVYYGSKEAESVISSDGWKTDAVYLLTNVPTGANYFRVMIDNTVINNTDVTFVPNNYGLKESIEILNKDIYGDNANANWDGEGKGIRVDTGSDADAANRNRTDFLSISEIGSIVFDAQNPFYYIVFYALKDTSSFISSFGWKHNTVYYPSVDKPVGANYFRVLIDTTTVETENIEFTLLNPGIKENSIRVYNVLKSILVVSADGSGDYTTIEAALAAAKDSINHHVTIFIKPGIYTPAPKTPDSTPYQNGNRNISLIGLDRDACILTGDVGYYYYQEDIDYGIIRLGGNVLIKNLTIISTCSQYETVATEKGWDLTNPHAKAYCIHADYPYSQDGDVMRIENCKLYNDHFSCIGWGIRPHCELLIKDCEIIADVSVETELKSGFSNYGAIYGHLSGRLNAYNQKLSVIRCLIKNVNFDCGIHQMLGISEFDEVSSQLKFVQNVVRTTNMQNAFINTLVNGYPLVNTIDEMSYGNNVPSMNYNEP